MPGQLYRTNPSAAALTRPAVWNRVGGEVDAREGAATAATRPAAVAVTRVLRDKERGGGGCMWPSFEGGDGRSGVRCPPRNAQYGPYGTGALPHAWRCSK